MNETYSDGNPVIVHHARPPISEWIPGANGGLDDPSRLPLMHRR